MRSAYGAQLAALTDELADLCQLAEIAMDRATRSLLRSDLHAAEDVIGEHESIAAASVHAEESCLALLALQAPVGRDLRSVIGSIQIAADLERMGALALHVAEAARRRHPQCAVPEDVAGCFAEMGRIAVELADNARQVIVSHDLGRARYIREADDAMDDLHRHLFSVMIQREWKHNTKAAVDVTLLSRYYERFADHAVQVARRVIFQVTGHIHARAKIGSPDRTLTPARLSTAPSG